MENEEKDLKQQLEDLKAEGYKNNMALCIRMGFTTILIWILSFLVGYNRSYAKCYTQDYVAAAVEIHESKHHREQGL